MVRSKDDDRRYFRLFIKNRVLSVLLTSITPLILVSVIILYQFYTSYHEKVHAHLGTLVNKHKQNIDSFLKEKLGNIRFLAENHSFDELKDNSFLQVQLALLQKELTLLRYPCNERKDFLEIFLFRRKLDKAL